MSYLHVVSTHLKNNNPLTLKQLTSYSGSLTIRLQTLKENTYDWKERLEMNSKETRPN